MANGSSTPDVLLLAIVARLIAQIDGTQGGPLASGVTSDDDSAGQPTVNITTPDPSWVGDRIRISGTNGTETHFVSTTGMGQVTLDENLTFDQPGGSTYTIYSGTDIQLTSGNCGLAIDPGNEPFPPAGDRSVLVIPEGGSFDQELLDGGGQEQATIETSVAIRVYSPSQLDSPGTDTQMLTNSAVGVMQIVTAILKALTIWTPLDNGSSPLVRQPLRPIATAVSKDGRRLAWFEVQFSVMTDWDLS